MNIMTTIAASEEFNREAISAPFFDKSTTGVIKGIALIMMFVHHFFTFPSFWGEGISYPLFEKISAYISEPLKLCVYVFAFITGYFYFFQKKKTYRYSFKKITDILISYWIVFLLFAFIAAIFVKYEYTFSDFILEFFALKRPTMIFCWYVNFYIIFMLYLPLISKIMSKNIHLDLLLSLIVIPNIFRIALYFVDNTIISELIRNQQNFISIVLVGYIFASYGLFEKTYALNMKLIKHEKLNALLLLLIALIVPFGRYFSPILTLDFGRVILYIRMETIYAPIFIYSIACICKAFDVKFLKKPLIIIGKYSLLMWFLSCAFFNNCKSIFQPVLYFPHDAFVVTIWGLLMCLCVSFLLDKPIKILQKLKDKLFRFQN